MDLFDNFFVSQANSQSTQLSLEGSCQTQPYNQSQSQLNELFSPSPNKESVKKTTINTSVNGKSILKEKIGTQIIKEIKQISDDVISVYSQSQPEEKSVNDLNANKRTSNKLVYLNNYQNQMNNSLTPNQINSNNSNVVSLKEQYLKKMGLLKQKIIERKENMINEQIQVLNKEKNFLLTCFDTLDFIFMNELNKVVNENSKLCEIDKRIDMLFHQILLAIKELNN